MLVPAKLGKSVGAYGAHPQPSSSNKSGSGERPKRRLLHSQEDIDLAKAYAIRAQREKAEQIESERLKQEASTSTLGGQGEVQSVDQG